jgi:hypothetical protein
MRVDKFLTAEFALQDLTQGHMKISTFPDMKDPFELLGGFESDPDLRRSQDAITAELNQLCGVLCFSRSWHNALLWSHYGDKHKGICLGIDITGPARVELTKPSYVTKREDFDASIRVLLAAAANFRDLTPEHPTVKGCEEITKSMILTKFKAWRYEKELRMFCDLRAYRKKGRFYFADFDEHIRPSAVIVGPRCKTAADVIEAAAAKYRAPIVRTMLSASAFEVVEQATLPSVTRHKDVILR